MLKNLSFCCALAVASGYLFLTTCAVDIPTATNNYRLSYDISLNNESVAFQIVGVTTGYVAFGFTNISGMVQSDIFIAGVYENGTSYFGDYTSYEAAPPRLDAEQNWELLEATQDAGVTTVRFSRSMITTDPLDIAITDRLMNIIWALGPANDGFQYHGFSRSTLKYNLVSNTNGGEEPIPPPGFKSKSDV